MTSSEVHVILACDRAFRMQVAVTARSVCESFSFGTHGLAFHVFATGFTAVDRKTLAASLRGYPVEIEWHAVDASGIRMARTHGHVSLASYFRILAFGDLARRQTRAIYLDCDLVLAGNLAELWELELAPGKTLGAAQDPGVPFFDAEAAMGRGHPGLERLLARHALAACRPPGLPAAAPYFNAGVLLVDLSAWARGDMTAKVLDFLEREWRHIVMWDQDALNALLWDQWEALPFKWNVQPQSFRFAEGESPFPWEEFARARLAPSIFHYAAARKPWHGDYPGPFREAWFEALDRTTYAGWRPGPRDRLLRAWSKPWRYLRDGLCWHTRNLLEKRHGAPREGPP